MSASRARPSCTTTALGRAAERSSGPAVRRRRRGPGHGGVSHGAHVTATRAFLARLTDTFVVRCHLAGIVIRDISVYTEVHIADRALSLTERFTAVLTRPEPTAADRLIAAAILGTILRPLTDPLIETSGPATGDTLVHIASTIARQIAPRSPPDESTTATAV